MNLTARPSYELHWSASPYNPWKDIPAAPVGGIDPPLVTKDDTLYIPKCDNTDDCSIPEHDEQADTLVAKNAKRDDLDFTSGPLTTGHRLGRRSCFDRNLEQKGGNGVLSYRDQFISQVSVWYLRVQAAGIQYVIRKFQGQLNFVPNIPGVTNDQSFQVDHCFELWIIKQFAYDAVDAGWFPGYNHDFFAATHSPDVSINLAAKDTRLMPKTLTSPRILFSPLHSSSPSLTAILISAASTAE